MMENLPIGWLVLPGEAGLAKAASIAATHRAGNPETLGSLYEDCSKS